jgi:preprotein translocase subunit YajC
MSFNFLAAAADASGSTSIWVAVGYMVFFFGLLYVLLILPQNKKKKKEEKMRNSIEIGDEIVTIGGIVGKVVGIKEENEAFIIETGTDRSKLKIKKWAVGSVLTIHDNAE